MKTVKAEPTRDVKFLALPNVSDVDRMLEDTAGFTDVERERLVRQYENKLQRIRFLQGKAAVLALAACRPEDYRNSERERRMIVNRANYDHEQRCLAVFSEHCTRGL